MKISLILLLIVLLFSVILITNEKVQRDKDIKKLCFIFLSANKVELTYPNKVYYFDGLNATEIFINENCIEK